MMDKKPLVSVIVASYNYAEYIGQTLESVLCQTYDNLEVIVVDDGSKDNSVEVIEGFVKKDKRVKIYFHEGGVNKGLPATVKLGVEKASGEWIAFCETDDYWREDYLEKKLAYAQKWPDVAIITNDLQMFGEDAAAVKKREVFHGLFDIVLKRADPFDAFFELYHQNVLSTFSAIMVKADVLKNVDFNSEIPAWLDWWMWRQIAFVHPIGGINEKLTFWRVHADSYNASKKGKDTSKRFIKAADAVLKKKHGSEFGAKMKSLRGKFVGRWLKKKAPKVWQKGDYLRFSIFGVSFLKIKNK